MQDLEVSGSRKRFTNPRQCININTPFYRLFFIAPYGQYIRDFKWESLKYPTKRSLNELAIQIQKNMHQKDEQIRKNMDEFNNMKQKISGMTKKDTGSLQVRDFTDEIYKGQ